jgi:SAM-dependent methyltransferase
MSLLLHGLWLLVYFSGLQAAEIAAPYVPTAPSVVERMLELAKVGPGDYVIDLGSGDGRIVIAAARKYGARAHGIEFEPQLVALAKANAKEAGISERATFEEGDLWTADLSRATVVTIYLLSRSTMKLRDRLFELAPGTRIVSHAGSMGEWKADHFEMLEVKDKVREDAPSRTYLYLWTVPAKAGGTWRWSSGVRGVTRNYELALSQHFQKLTGTARAGAARASLEEATLHGERMRVTFTAELDGRPVRHLLEGRVHGDSVEGTLTIAGDTGNPLPWQATRITRAVPAEGSGG